MCAVTLDPIHNHPDIVHGVALTIAAAAVYPGG